MSCVRTGYLFGVVMNKGHIAFISYPFPAFVNPTLPIVSILLRRGYRVTYATTESFANRVAALGAEVVLCPSIPTERTTNSAKEDDGALRRTLEDLVAAIPTMEKLYKLDRPSVIVYGNMAPSGHILTRKLNIPGIQICSTFALNRENLHRQIRDATLRRNIVQTSAKVDRFIQQQGVSPNDYFFARDTLNIYLFPVALQPMRDVVGNTCFYAGRCPAEQSYFGDWQPTKLDGRPTILVSTSSMYVRGPEYFKMFIEALRNLHCHVILSIGFEGSSGEYENLPSNFEVVSNVSHIKILPYVSLFACLGGIITTAESMYHGVPMLVTSHGFKELEWQGDNIEDTGVGVHLKKSDTSVGSIREFAAEMLADKALYDRMGQAKFAARREAGAEEVANRIEEVLNLEG